MDGNHQPIGRTRAAENAGEKADSKGPPSRDGASGLLSLIEGKPHSKLGRVRWHWPEIKVALRNGHQLKRVWECLVQDGVDLSWSKFRTYVVRLRRLEAAGVELPAVGTKSCPSEPVQAVAPKHDPLANLRERMSKRPGFEFDERPPDKKKLI